MRQLVLCLVDGVSEQNSIINTVRVADCTADLAIIASNDSDFFLEVSRPIWHFLEVCEYAILGMIKTYGQLQTQLLNLV